MTVARLASRSWGSTGPGFAPFVFAGMVCCWSGRLRQGGDLGPDGGYRVCPGPGPGDFQPPAAHAADQSGRGVQDPVPQGLGCRTGQVAVEGDEPQPGLTRANRLVGGAVSSSGVSQGHGPGS